MRSSLWGPISRTRLVQQDAVPYPLTFDRFRIHDDYGTLLPTTPGSENFGVINNLLGTDTPTLETEDHKGAGSSFDNGRVQFVVPPEYVPGQTITLRVNAAMKTTVADSSATIDAVCYRHADPSTDIVVPAAQNMNSLTPADFDFEIFPGNVVVGDILDINLISNLDDGATGTAVIGQIISAKLLLDIKG